MRCVLRGVWRIRSAWRRAEALACECPPAPAVGRHLLLYFVRKGLRTAFGVRRRVIERLPRALRSTHRTPSLVGAGRGLGKVKEEVTANGRRRGTFAQTPACPGGALQFAANRNEGTRAVGSFCVAQGGGPCVRMSSGAGRWPSPPPLLRTQGSPPCVRNLSALYWRQPARCLGRRKPNLVGAGRGLGKVKEEVTANGRRRGTFAQAPARPGGAHQLAGNPDEEALLNPDNGQKKTRQREGSAGSGLHGGRDPCNERCVASVTVRVRR